MPSRKQDPIAPTRSRRVDRCPPPKRGRPPPAPPPTPAADSASTTRGAAAGLSGTCPTGTAVKGPPQPPLGAASRTGAGRRGGGPARRRPPVDSTLAPSNRRRAGARHGHVAGPRPLVSGRPRRRSCSTRAGAQPPRQRGRPRRWWHPHGPQRRRCSRHSSQL